MRPFAVALGLSLAVVLTSPTAVFGHEVGEFIPGLTLESAVERLGRFGLECKVGGTPNRPDPPPDMLGADCTGRFPSGMAIVTALLNYWPDGHSVEHRLHSAAHRQRRR
jgi:hypothetical protein